MADADFRTTAPVVFDYQDCRVCGAKHAPHYKACKGQRCVSCHNEYQRGYRKRMEKSAWNIDKDRKYHLKKHYGISVPEFNAIGDRQGWSCAACGLKFDLTQRANKPHVDHCHGSGVVRGLLCNGCNRALGFINDDPAIARKLAEYLERAAE